MKGTAKLCKCNNCDSILIDENPQVDAKEHELTGIEKNMEYVKDEEAQDCDYFWACPECLTDGYLVDL